jgi:hypothetical protein
MKTQLNNVWNTQDSEVALFRKMKNILSQHYLVDLIEETHMHYVEFHSNTLNQTVRKEISDLWIIAFSPTRNKARMTFLQAKYERTNNLSITPKFTGDFFQYELLSTRPQINNVGRKFLLPPDILSFSCCSSVGSFGVFFIDSNSDIDLAYCSANQLTNLSRIPTTKTNNNVTLQMPALQLPINFCNCTICTELLNCLDIDTFTTSLINLEIGAELTADATKLTQIKALLNAFKEDNPAVEQFLNFGGEPPNPDEGLDSNSDEGSFNLLIINTDEKASS